MSQILNYCFKSRKHCLSRYILNLKILGPPLISKAPPFIEKACRALPYRDPNSNSRDPNENSFNI